MIDVVPLEPAIDGPTCDTAFDGDVGYSPAGDVRTYRAATPPLAEVVLELRFDDELIELFQLRATATRAMDCLPRFGCHDRGTMILLGSFVNPDLNPRDPV